MSRFIQSLKRRVAKDMQKSSYQNRTVVVSYKQPNVSKSKALPARF